MNSKLAEQEDLILQSARFALIRARSFLTLLDNLLLMSSLGESFHVMYLQCNVTDKIVKTTTQPQQNPKTTPKQPNTAIQSNEAGGQGRRKDG